MNPRWLALLLALVLSFSGCLGFSGEDDPEGQENDSKEEDPGTSQDDPEQDPTGEDDPDEAPETTNEAPEASLAVNLTQGEAPLNVTLSLDASDADEDPLTWTLDLGDGSDLVEGDTLPFELEHPYEEAGNFTVVFTVSDGNETDSAEALVAVQQPPEPILDTSLSWGPPGNTGCGGPYDVWEFETPLAGILFGELALPEEAAGVPFEVQVQGATLELGFLAFDFYDAEGTLLAMDQDTFAFEDELTVKGTVPTGASWILFMDCLTEGGGEADILVG